MGHETDTTPQKTSAEKYAGQQAPPEAQPGTQTDPDAVEKERDEQRRQLNETTIGNESSGDS